MNQNFSLVLILITLVKFYFMHVKQDFTLAKFYFTLPTLSMYCTSELYVHFTDANCTTYFMHVKENFMVRTPPFLPCASCLAVYLPA